MQHCDITPELRIKGLVCVEHTCYKKGVCGDCSICRKFPLSPSFQNHQCHSYDQTQGHPWTQQITGEHTPQISQNTNCGSNWCDGGQLVNNENNQIGDHDNDIIPEQLCLSNSKKEKLHSLMSLLNIPAHLVHKIPSDGINNISGDGDSSELRRAVSVLISVIDSVGMLLMKDESESISLKK